MVWFFARASYCGPHSPPSSSSNASGNYGVGWFSLYCNPSLPLLHLTRTHTCSDPALAALITQMTCLSLSVSLLTFISITESNISQWKSQAAEINAIFQIFMTWHYTADTHSTFHNRRWTEKRQHLVFRSVNVCVFEPCVCVYVSWWATCGFLRINNLYRFAAGEDPVRTWLKLFSAASESEVNKRGR